MDLRKNGLVFLNVFQYVESANDVELTPKRNFPGIHLHEVNRRQTIGRETQAFNKNLATMKTCIAIGSRQPGHNISGTAPYLEE